LGFPSFYPLIKLGGEPTQSYIGYDKIYWYISDT
jgi:hypothetical protein